MSRDGRWLYVALADVGGLAVVDLDTWSLAAVFDLSALMGSTQTYDIVELAPHRLLVSAAPDSGDLAYLVELDPQDPNSAHRVEGEIAYHGALFHRGVDGKTLYIADAYTNGFIYRHEIAGTSLPLRQSGDPYGIGDIPLSRMSPDGTRLYLQNGPAISLTSLWQIDAIPVRARWTTHSLPVPSPDGRFVYTLQSDGERGPISVVRFSASRMEPLAALEIDCPNTYASRAFVSSDGARMIGSGTDGYVWEFSLF